MVFGFCNGDTMMETKNWTIWAVPWKTIKTWNVIYGWFVSPDGEMRVRIGKNCTIDDGVFMGNGVRVGWDVCIGDGVLVGRDTTIGNGARVGRDATIGDGVRVGWNVCIGDGVRVGRDTTIGDGVRVGRDTIIGDGARVGKNCRIPKREKIEIGAIVSTFVVITDSCNDDGVTRMSMRMRELDDDDGA